MQDNVFSTLGWDRNGHIKRKHRK